LQALASEVCRVGIDVAGTRIFEVVADHEDEIDVAGCKGRWCSRHRGYGIRSGAASDDQSQAKGKKNAAINF